MILPSIVLPFFWREARFGNQPDGHGCFFKVLFSKPVARKSSFPSPLVHDSMKAVKSIPQGLLEKQGRISIAEMRNMEAQWYEDSANYLEDWIRPRKPAVTREELQRELDQMDQRSQRLVTRQKGFQSAELDVRNQLGVQPPRYDDALRTYTCRKPTQ